MSLAFSQALHNLLIRFPKRGPGPYGFPDDEADLRVRPDEQLEDWFQRIVNDYLDGDVRSCAIEDRFAIFFRYGCNGPQFRFVECQVFAVIEGTLSNHSPTSSRYLRLEYGMDKLGDLFGHPIPHIHSCPSGPPRFATEAIGCEHVLIDFLDFVYRNFAHDKWLKWAGAVCKKSAPELMAFLELIADAYKMNRIAGLPDKATDAIPRIKEALRMEKSQMPLALGIDAIHRQTFSYC